MTLRFFRREKKSLKIFEKKRRKILKNCSCGKPGKHLHTLTPTTLQVHDIYHKFHLLRVTGGTPLPVAHLNF